jgi:hypothetical protein
MPTIRTFDRSFATGEVTPELFGRLDLTKQQSGLKTCRNFVTLPHGPAANRAGFEYVATTKYSGASVSRLVPFIFSTTQSYVLEFGDLYIRIYTNPNLTGAGVILTTSFPVWSNSTAYIVGDIVTLSGTAYQCVLANTNQTPPNGTYWTALSSVAYEVTTPYVAADISTLKYVQSADVLTITHQNYAPMELRRYTNQWTLTAIQFAPTLSPPTGVGAVATTGSGSVTYSYVVTAIAATALDESLVSSIATCTNNLATAGNLNTVSWTAVTGATRYNVYRLSNGLYGFIGQTQTTSFQDQNITPATSVTPPEFTNPFASATNYPACVSYFEQRRVFAGTAAKPQNIWLTRSATENNLAASYPSRDNDAIAYRIAAREANTIKHIVPLTYMLLFTQSAEWQVAPEGNTVLTPSSFSCKPRSYNGCSDVQPITVGNNVIYAQGRGGRIREMSYQWQAAGYISTDMSIMAPHLFDGYTIKDMALVKSPYQMVWAVSSTGQLLGMTYIPEQEVAGWHRHDTINGTFESICAVPEGPEDVLYAIVKRTINGSTVRYIERMRSRQFMGVAANAFFVDCGATYNGAPTTTVTGLTWLEGQTVSILGDGSVMPQAVVTGGAVTLPQAASVIQVGLPITADLEDMPVADEQLGGYGAGLPKNVNKVFIKVKDSSGIYAGPSFSKLIAYRQRTTENWGSAPALQTGEIQIVTSASWTTYGTVCIRQTDPLPLTIVSIAKEVAVGG